MNNTHKKNKLDIIIILFVFLFTFLTCTKLPYYIDTDGGVIDVGKRIDIDKKYYKGSLNMTYVRSMNATPITYLFAVLNPNWDILTLNEENGTSTEKEAEFASVIGKNRSQDCAIITAFNYSNKNYNIIDKKIYVTYIIKEAKTNLKVGDIIDEIDNIKINSKEDIKKYINSKSENDRVYIKVTNDNKHYIREANIIKIDDVLYIGAVFDTDYDLSYSPKIDFNFKESEKGPSGGLMLALSIYSKINKTDITKGYKISGTGTIDEYGNVGEIGGVKYKLRGAVNKKMDVFFVPKENYKEALKEKKKNKYKIKIYSVSTFNDAINYLKNLEE